VTFESRDARLRDSLTESSASSQSPFTAVGPDEDQASAADVYCQ